MAFDPGGKTNAAINVTPLIDILLVRLITFLLITPVTPKGEDARIPKDSPRQPARIEDVVVLQLSSATGSVDAVQLAINRQKLPWTQLDDTLRQIFKQRGDKTLFLTGDCQIDFRYIAQAVDIAHSAGVDNVALMKLSGR